MHLLLLLSRFQRGCVTHVVLLSEDCSNRWSLLMPRVVTINTIRWYRSLHAIIEHTLEGLSWFFVVPKPALHRIMIHNASHRCITATAGTSCIVTTGWRMSETSHHTWCNSVSLTAVEDSCLDYHIHSNICVNCGRLPTTSHYVVLVVFQIQRAIEPLSLSTHHCNQLVVPNKTNHVDWMMRGTSSVQLDLDISLSSFFVNMDRITHYYMGTAPH